MTTPTHENQNGLWALEFLQDEILSFLLVDLEQGRRLSDKALIDGIACHMIDQSHFMAGAPFLDISPGLVCFHVEKCRVNCKGYGIYHGPVMLIVDPNKIEAEHMISSLSLSGRLTTLQDALTEFQKTAN